MSIDLSVTVILVYPVSVAVLYYDPLPIVINIILTKRTVTTVGTHIKVRYKNDYIFYITAFSEISVFFQHIVTAVGYGQKFTTLKFLDKIVFGNPDGGFYIFFAMNIGGVFGGYGTYAVT